MASKKLRSAVLGAVLGVPTLASALPLTFNTFVQQADINTIGGTTQVIGFAFAGNKFVGSLYPSNSQLYQTDLSGGSVTPFGAPIPGASSELYVSSSLGLGGFASRDIYASGGPGKGLYRINNNGSSQGVFAVTGATSLNSEYVKGIAFDPYGNYGHDMIVSTGQGNLYRVNAAGVATLLANMPGQILEGIDFSPAGFGPVGGQVVVASESANTLFAVSTAGTVTNMNTLFGVLIGAAEEIGFVPLDLGLGGPLEGFYAAAYPGGGIQKANASQFLGMLGDAVVTSEFGSSSDPVTGVHWDGTKFVLTALGNLPGQAEDGIFVTQAIIRGGGVPEPATLALMLAGLAGVGLRKRRAV